LRSGVGSATPEHPVAAPEPGIGAKHGALFKRIAIDVLPQSDQTNRCPMIAMDCFTKWLEAYAIPNQEASMVVEALVTNFFCGFRVLTRAVTSSPI
jgi:hypothetical protein